MERARLRSRAVRAERVDGHGTGGERRADPHDPRRPAFAGCARRPGQCRCSLAGGREGRFLARRRAAGERSAPKRPRHGRARTPDLLLRRDAASMMHKVILLTDPGIDGAFATALALYDPDIDVLGLAATAGNVSADQATTNVQILVEQFDPPRWPRLGAALPVNYEIDGQRLHGPGGLGGVSFPSAQLHHQHSSDKLLIDLVRMHPREITMVVLGPLTAVARAFDRDPELPVMIQRLICVGG